MEPFKTCRGVIAPLDRANVDTDAIIPKQFLKSVSRTGFGEELFHDWRYRDQHRPDPDFVLNRPAFRGAKLLVARNNFGCGSSREHAVWAICQYGFRAVIAPWAGEGKHRTPGFADIFRNNSVKNGLLTVELSEPEVAAIFRSIEAQPGVEATLDLKAQTLTLHRSPEAVYRFEIDPHVKERFLLGLDDIGITLQEEAAITAFEKKHQTQCFPS
ncbi:MAG: 3-isopropylmalate dehydratase small subunit [Candidatus Omnitrophica bacterium]|nr:3-isopropylmalate dehydratase small subunit [Candidatus Omnitrophota bacterium]